MRSNKVKIDKKRKKESKIDRKIKEWKINLKEKEKGKKKIISEIDNFINQFYKLKVTTFHAFCNDIIDEFSIEIGVTQDPYIENNAAASSWRATHRCNRSRAADGPHRRREVTTSRRTDARIESLHRTARLDAGVGATRQGRPFRRVPGPGLRLPVPACHWPRRG